MMLVHSTLQAAMLALSPCSVSQYLQAHGYHACCRPARTSSHGKQVHTPIMTAHYTVSCAIRWSWAVARVFTPRAVTEVCMRTGQITALLASRREGRLRELALQGTRKASTHCPRTQADNQLGSYQHTPHQKISLCLCMQQRWQQGGEARLHAHVARPAYLKRSQ